MGLFKEIGKVVGGVGKSVGNILGGLGGSVGGILNDVTGQTSAGKVNQAYAKELAKINQEYALESMAKQQEYALANMRKQNQYEVTAAKNAHQWEISDLEKAGLNPILSAGGQGAQADTSLAGAGAISGSAGAGSQGASGIDIMQSLTSAGKMLKEWNAIKAGEEKTRAETAGIIAHNPNISKIDKSEIAKNEATAIKASQEAQTEPWKRDLIASEAGLNIEKNRNLQYINELNNKDLEMLDKIGITRRELIDIGKEGIHEILGLLKAGKMQKAVETLKRKKK